jgi:DNA-binding CsgD family transcriptional regulator
MSSVVRLKAKLTPGQLRILQLTADGKRACEISETLEKKPDAIRTTMWRIMNRLGANTRSGAVARALRLGLIK